MRQFTISDPRYVRIGAALAAVALSVAGAILLAGLATYYYLAPTLPEVAQLRDVRLQVPLRIYTRDGRLLAQIGEQRRIPVRFEDVPKQVVNAFLAAEDDRFFSHGGIDTWGLMRALAVTAVTHEARQGGSTITMQLARNMFLTPEKELRRKLREIFLAFRIESEFSKQEILTLYLNKIFLGERAYGVAAAAEVYYGKDLSQLTIAEIATIAALPKAPSTLNPIANPERARQRRAYVLRRMLEKGYITSAEHDGALAAPIETTEHGARVEVEAPYVAEMVRAELADKYGEELYSAGYEVRTSIDSRLQRAADWSLRAALLEYDRRHGWRGASGHAARPPADAREAAQMLEHFAPAGGLVPAVVDAVAAKSATAFGKDGRHYTLPWESGLAWARRADKGNGPGAPPREAREVLAPGDVVYLLPSGGGFALLAQIPLVQGAFVSLDPQDGAITALAGGFDFYLSKFNRVVQARRQPGSSFKPFIYSGALERGFTPATVVLDAPVVIEGAGMEDMWRPENDAKHFYGPTRLRDALARSRNLVSIRILRALGVDYAIDYATRFGFDSDELPHNLTMALGTAQLTPLEMAAGFAVFANSGFRVQPYLIERVSDAAGTTLYAASPVVACLECTLPVEPPLPPPAAARAAGGAPEAPPEPAGPPPPSPAAVPAPVATAGATLHPVGADAAGVTHLAELADGALLPRSKHVAPRVISAANAYLMTDLMRDVIRRGTGRRALALKRDDIAGKTGTTNDRRDTWFSGFNADLVATAWVGFDQERSLGAGEEGGHTALPMWVYFMGEALAGRPEHRLPQPEGIVSARISPLTGEPARGNDPDAIFELFLAGRLPGSGGVAGDGAGLPAAKPGEKADEPIF
ncbi:MAG TPA: penicillin-binding protein 1A [Steroidobacteraceae bacterium]|nr:penicillin-binding protein 1A [Steroidobacteraceae bacterium]